TAISALSRLLIQTQHLRARSCVDKGVPHGLPLPDDGERVGVRGRRWLCYGRSKPLTRRRSAADLSSTTGGGEAGADAAARTSRASTHGTAARAQGSRADQAFGRRAGLFGDLGAGQHAGDLLTPVSGGNLRDPGRDPFAAVERLLGDQIVTLRAR